MEELEHKRNHAPLETRSGQALTPVQIRLRDRLERFYALTTDLICILAFDGHFIDINPGFEKLLGFSRAEIMANPFIYCVVPEDRPATLEEFAGLLRGNETTGFENRYICKDGTWKWLSWNATIDPAEELVFGVAHDITGLKKAEAALKEKNSTLVGIIENTEASIFSVDRGYHYSSFNHRHAAIMQAIYGKEIKIGESLLDNMTVAIDREAAKRNIDRALAGEQFIESAYSGEDARSRLYFEVSHNPIRAGDGTVIGVSVFSNDVTDRKRAENEILMYTQRLTVINRLDHIISSSLDVGTVYDAFVGEMKSLVTFDRTAITFLDEAGENIQIFRQWTQGNPAFQPSVWLPMKGMATEWVVQNRQAFLENRLGETTHWPEHTGLRQEGIQSRVLLPLIVQDKVIGMLSLASRQPDAYPVGDVALLQTLADQMAIAVQNSRLYEQARFTAEDLELRVKARTAQLEESNQDLESFSYSVSHDLRAPLRAINGFSHILAESYREKLDDEEQHYLDNVLEASTRMGLLIDDLLHYSRLGRSGIHRRAVSLEKLFEQIRGDLAPRIIESQAEVRLPPPGSMPVIQSDATLLSQIFTNIINNALTYHKEGIPPEIQVTYHDEGNRFLFGIADNGIGIPAEFLGKIFEVFQRLHTTEEYPGTGIGLAIVKKSVGLLNGQVWVDSTEGVGSTFCISFPKE